PDAGTADAGEYEKSAASDIRQASHSFPRGLTRVRPLRRGPHDSVRTPLPRLPRIRSSCGPEPITAPAKSTKETNHLTRPPVPWAADPEEIPARCTAPP